MLPAGLAVLIAGYYLLRSPSGIYGDYLKAGLLWKYALLHAAEWPERAERPLLNARLLPRGPFPVELPGGARILAYPDDLISRMILTFGDWEPEEWGWIESHLCRGDYFVDVGAHHGTYAVRAARIVGKEGRVVAIEPNPESIARLRQNIQLNGLQNVEVFQAACGGARGRTTFHAPGGQNTGMSSISERIARQPGADLHHFEAEVFPLDDLVAAVPEGRIRVIKIDVEGAETMVLRGARETIRKHSPLLVVEVVAWQLQEADSSVEELEHLLRSYGYGKLKSTRYNALWARQE